MMRCGSEPDDGLSDGVLCVVHSGPSVAMALTGFEPAGRVMAAIAPPAVDGSVLVALGPALCALVGSDNRLNMSCSTAAHGSLHDLDGHALHPQRHALVLALMRNKTFRIVEWPKFGRFSANAGRRQGPEMLSSKCGFATLFDPPWGAAGFCRPRGAWRSTKSRHRWSWSRPVWPRW